MRKASCFLSLAAAALLAFTNAAADPRPRDLMDGTRLRLALKKLQVTGTALYVGAHPDDENTAFLSWLSNGRLVRAGYLSLTRGDGGQNLIGSETGEALGVVRTQELIAARRIDGAEQFFTRALDFGFSKKAEETLALWDRERILSDVVWVIRRVQPDVIVTRFPPDSTAGHGHHTASAMLAIEAFAAAGDSTRFREQLASVPVWKAKRIVWNVFRPSTQPRDPARPPLLTVDLGTYEPLLGRAHTEIAGQSRSMHKSQGFGSAERRGSIPSTLEHVAGTPAERDLFDGIDLSWRRVRGGERIGTLLHQAERAFDPEHPAQILPTLMDAYAALMALPSTPLVETKRRELVEVIRSAAGLWIEAVAAGPTALPGTRLPVTISVLNRSDAALAVQRLELPYGAEARPADAAMDSLRRGAGAGWTLPPNRTVGFAATVPLPADLPITQPYWLRLRPRAGSSDVEDPLLIGTPENPPVVSARVTLGLGARSVTLDVPVVHRSVDPVQGERYRALEIVPPVTCRFDHEAYLFPDDQPRDVLLTLESGDTTVTDATVRLELPQGWKASPEQGDVRFSTNERERMVRFRVTPAAGPAAATLNAVLTSGGKPSSYRLTRIDHPHIPIQTLFPAAEAKLVRVNLRVSGALAGYLMGSGDQVPDALRQMGFQVTLLSDQDVATTDLSRFDVIVSGVRAYNTRPRLRALQTRLLDYVAAGGRLVIQYVTPDESLVNRLGPHPFTVSRDRVTVEQADMRFLDPQHALLQSPNRIGADDFRGWVQERGLSYANPWDPRYQTVLSANDPGETPKDGGILYAPHGRGVFIYTGLAWFRQLPGGVPGAYRLFANLVSATKRQ